MQSTLGILFVFVFPILQTLSIMVRKTRAKKISTQFSSAFQSVRFCFEKNQEVYEKLIVFRPIWVEHRVILDVVDS